MCYMQIPEHLRLLFYELGNNLYAFKNQHTDASSSSKGKDSRSRSHSLSLVRVRGQVQDRGHRGREADGGRVPSTRSVSVRTRSPTGLAIKNLQSEERRDVVSELNLPAVSAAKQSDPIVQLSVQFKNTVKDCARRVQCLDVRGGLLLLRRVAVPRRAVLAQRDGGGAAESGHRLLPTRCRCSKSSRRRWRSRALSPSALDHAAGSNLKEVCQVLPVCNSVTVSVCNTMALSMCSVEEVSEVALRIQSVTKGSAKRNGRNPCFCEAHPPCAPQKRGITAFLTIGVHQNSTNQNKYERVLVN